MKTVIIIPTYNERDNIEALLDALWRQFDALRHEMHVLVVDDSSPDGTADAIRALQPRRANLHLLTGPKQGLGVAYIRGMRHAMDALGAEVVFEMDADFSHKPEDVPRLLAEIERGADFAIGSRYVRGGSIPQEWGLYRRLNSQFGNIVARYLAGLYPVRDCTAGFRAIRTDILRRIDFDKLGVQGYAFQVALLHAATTLKAKIVEIPVDFIDRTQGESKLGLRDVIEFIINAWWIRFDSSKTFFKFLAVGASGVVVNLGAFTLLLLAGVNKFVASPLAIELSIISNFLFNNFWTFRQRVTKDRIRVKGLKFNAVSLLSLGVSYGSFVALSLLFPDAPPQLHQLIGILPATFVNYFLNSYWTFKHVEVPAGMSHESFVRHEEPQGPSDRSFGLVFSGVFGAAALLAYLGKLPVSPDPAYWRQWPLFSAYPALAPHGFALALAAVGLVFLLLAGILPRALGPLNWLWTQFGLLLHKIVSPIVLGVLFFLVFTPLGLAMRLFGGDPLRLRFQPDAPSYWIERSPPGPAPDSLKNQF